MDTVGSEMTVVAGTSVPAAPIQGLLGREADLAAVEELLSAHQVVVLTGPPGVGKSALAAEVARRIRATAGEVRWIDLADPVPHPGARPGSAEPPAASALVVFDNAEAAVDEIAELVLHLRPEGSRILVTSRRRVSLPGSAVRRLAPLEVSDRDTDPEETAGPAVRLFFASAGAAGAVLPRDAAARQAAVDICRAVGGLPLGIELAARRAAVLDPGELAGRLVGGLAVLGSDPAAPARHRSLPHAFEDSRRLLGQEEQAALARLAVFAGAFSLAAAEAVLPVDGAVPAERVLDVVAALADHSLLQLGEVAGRVLYSFLPPVRRWAVGLLGTDPAADEVRRRHARWARDQVIHPAADPDRPGAGGGAEGIEGIEEMEADLEAALAWTLGSTGGSRQRSLTLELFDSLGRLWQVAGHLGEAQRWAEPVLAVAAEADDADAALARERLAALMMPAGRIEDARNLWSEALRYWTAAAAVEDRARCLAWLGRLARLQADYPRAHQLLKQSVGELGERPDAAPMANALEEMGALAAARGQRPTAELILQEALARHRANGNSSGQAAVLGRLGKSAAGAGKVADAARYYEAALDVGQRARDRIRTGRAMAAQAEVAWRSDDLGWAETRCAEAAAVQRRSGDTRGLGTTLAHAGFVAFLKGDYGRSVDLFGQSIELRERTGDRRGLASAMTGQAAALFYRQGGGPAPEAVVLAEKAAAVQAEIEAESGLAWTTHWLSEMAREAGEAGDRLTARSRAEESLALYRRLGIAGGTSFPLYSLAALALEEGHGATARVLVSDALEASGRQPPAQRARCLELAARILGAGEAWDAAVVAAGTVGAWRGRVGPRARLSSDGARMDACLDLALEALGQATWNRCWAEGHRLDLDQGLRVAVDALNRAAASSGGTSAPTRIRVRLLGRFSVDGPEGTLAFSGPVAARLVKAVALIGRVHIEELVDLLWPDVPLATGRRRLTNLMARLPREAGPLLHRDGAFIRLADGVEVDVGVFAEGARAALAALRSGGGGAVAQGREAVAAYTGELLPASRFEDWTSGPRVHLAGLYVQLLDELAAEEARQGRDREAVEWLERAIEADPYDQDRYDRALRILLARGWRSRAAALVRRAEAAAAELDMPLVPALARAAAELRTGPRR